MNLFLRQKGGQWEGSLTSLLNQISDHVNKQHIFEKAEAPSNYPIKSLKKSKSLLEWFWMETGFPFLSREYPKKRTSSAGHRKEQGDRPGFQSCLVG